jgi:hypothetical protein
VDAGEQWLESMMGISAAMDEIIAKTKAAGQAAAGAASSSTTTRTNTSGGGGEQQFTVPGVPGLLDTIGKIADPFKRGGVVSARRGLAMREGRGGRLVMAHPGEIIDQPRRVVNRLAEAVRAVDRGRGSVRTRGGSGGGDVHVHVAPGAINYQGGLMTHADRDFESITTILAQRIGERLRR